MLGGGGGGGLAVCVKKECVEVYVCYYVSVLISRYRYSSVRKLVKLEVVQFILENHTVS